MIDDFLRDLFGGDTLSGAPGTFDERFSGIRAPLIGGTAEGPASFGERFSGVPEAPKPDLSRLFGPGAMDSAGNGLAPAQTPADRFEITPFDYMNKPQAIELSAKAHPDAGGGVPMPQPRPDVEALLAGVKPRMTAPAGAPVAVPSPPAAGDVLSRLLGPAAGGAQQATAPVQNGRQTILGRLFGMSPQQERALRASLAGGFAGGNPNFKGGAFMRGMSGSLSGGLASEQQQRKEETGDAAAKQKQENFNRSQTDKEKRTNALSRLYEARAKNVTSGSGRASAAWNKPPSERWKDAQRLILDKEKQVYANLPIGRSRDTAKAEADQALAKFKQDTYRAYGIDEQGNDLGTTRPGGAVPSTDKVVGDREAEARGLYDKGSHAGTYDDPHQPMTQDDFSALEKGTYFVNPADGQIMIKR